MATDFSEESATAAVVDSFAKCPDDRFRSVMESLVKHLHGFIREVEPTQQEWEQGIAFLTDVGHWCTDNRQEYILLSDVLGVSMLVDAINNRKPLGATESTVLGPFHVVDSPVCELGDDIALVGDSPRCVVRGHVRTVDGQPLPGGLLDVWQADDSGHYDIQLPDELPERNLRGLFTADDAGRFWFRTIVPQYYPIPDDGPVGRMLHATNRHPHRPAHIHFISGAEGFSPVVTHLFRREPLPGQRHRVRREGEPGPCGPADRRRGPGTPLWCRKSLRVHRIRHRSRSRRGECRTEVDCIECMT
jgi:protocatechuate 3,4-dioxygenase beta subunit